MTTSSDARIEPYWFGRSEQEVRAAVEARAEQWAPVPGYSRYLWSDKGQLRVSVNGDVMKTKVSNGYEAVKVVRDRDGKRPDVRMHVMVLLAHHPAFRGLDAFPEGMETRHNPVTGPLFNAYPEGLWPGTKKQNAADKDEQDPLHPCRNATAGCPNLVVTPGRRCIDCVAAVGREVAELLRLGMPLQQVAERFGYTGPDWAYQLAVRFGGYEGSKAEARTQRPKLGQRLRLAARHGSDAL